MRLAILLPALVALTEAATLHGCAGKCIGEAIASTGCSSADSSCICSSESFLSSINECVPQTCNPDEQDAAITFAQEFCHKIELAKRGAEPEPVEAQLETRDDSSLKKLFSRSWAPWPWAGKPKVPPHAHKAAPYHVPWYQKPAHSVISPPPASWYGTVGTVGTVWGGAAHWPPAGGPGKWGSWGKR